MTDTDAPPPAGDDLALDRSFAAPPEGEQRLTPLVRRVVASNAGPFTFTGTCSYIIGNGRVAILDPGPDDPTHIAALLDAVRGETVTHAVVTHTHRDHSPGAAAIRQATGAAIVGSAPYRPSPHAREPGSGGLDGAHDRSYSPETILADGDVLQGHGFTLEAVATPGHAANHLAFALREEESLFSGDHVMAWSTTVVAPPDGSMRDYMASLEKVRQRPEALYWPGHGGMVKEPHRFVRALLHHRRQREAAIVARLKAGDRDIPTLVERLYERLAPALRGAAGLSVLAHLEDLVERGLVVSNGAAGLDGVFAPA